MNTLTEAGTAYVAAMIDGEGTITISRVKNYGKRPGYMYRPVVNVTNSHAGLIGFLRSLTGVGIVYQNNITPKKENWSPIHRWQVSMAEARELLPVIAPYLVIKRELARVIMQLQPIPIKTTHAERIPLREAQHALWERIRAMNKRGFGGHKIGKELTDFPADHPLLSAD